MRWFVHWPKWKRNQGTFRYRHLWNYTLLTFDWFFPVLNSHVHFKLQELGKTECLRGCQYFNIEFLVNARNKDKIIDLNQLVERCGGCKYMILILNKEFTSHEYLYVFNVNKFQLAAKPTLMKNRKKSIVFAVATKWWHCKLKRR